LPLRGEEWSDKKLLHHSHTARLTKKRKQENQSKRAESPTNFSPRQRLGLNNTSGLRPERAN